MGDGRVPQVGRINTLRQQHEGVEKIQILGVVIESEHGFHDPCAHSEPRFETVVAESPVQFGMPFTEVTEIAIVDLQSSVKFVGNLGGDIRSEVGKGSAALAGMRAQPVILIGIKKSL